MNKHKIIFYDAITKYGHNDIFYDEQFIRSVMCSCEADMHQYGWLYLREIYVRLGIDTKIIREVPACLGWEGDDKFEWVAEYNPTKMYWEIMVMPNDLSKEVAI